MMNYYFRLFPRKVQTQFQLHSVSSVLTDRVSETTDDENITYQNAAFWKLIFSATRMVCNTYHRPLIWRFSFRALFNLSLPVRSTYFRNLSLSPKHTWPYVTWQKESSRDKQSSCRALLKRPWSIGKYSFSIAQKHYHTPATKPPNF